MITRLVIAVVAIVVTALAYVLGERAGRARGLRSRFERLIPPHLNDNRATRKLVVRQLAEKVNAAALEEQRKRRPRDFPGVLALLVAATLLLGASGCISGDTLLGAPRRKPCVDSITVRADSLPDSLRVRCL